jgi:ligand-binding sensor domain-containing protein
LLGLLISIGCFSQKLPFTTIGLKEGLPQLTVYKILQDRQGYIWILSEATISRYDGHAFINYPIHFGLEIDFVSDIRFDHCGRLCIATLGEGIAILDEGELKWINQSSGLPSNKISGLEFTATGELIIATPDKGILCIAANKTTRTLYPHHTSDLTRPRKLFVTKNGDVISTGKDGVFRLVKDQSYTPKLIVEGMTTLYSCLETGKGDIWMGGDRKLIQLSGNKKIDQTEILTTLDGEATNVWNISELKDRSALYFSTSKGLLTARNTKTKWLTTRNGLPFNDICGTFEDKFGNFWVATYAAGVAILDNTGMDHFDFSEEALPVFPVSLVDNGKGRIWMGSNYNESLFYFEKDEMHHYADKRLDGDRNLLHAMDLNPVNQEVWIGGNYGRVVKIKNNQVVFLKDMKDDLPIEHLSFLKNGTGVFCTRKGVYQMPVNGTELELIPEIPLLYFRSSFADENDMIWLLGKRGEIYSWKPGILKNHTASINPKKYLLEDGMYDATNKIWWFCSNGGLIGWNGTATFVLNLSNGLSTDFPWSITGDRSGRIWIGHKKGIECIDLKKNQVKFYGYDEGFSPVETNRGTCIKDGENNIWFGTISSASRIRLNDMESDTRTGQLRVQQVLAGNKTVYTEDYQDTACPALDLKYNENTLQFKLVALFYSNSKHVTYSWMLEGYDATWQTSKEQKDILYIDLPPGKYKFRAIAIGANGYKTNEITIPVLISRPFWKRPWFYIIQFSILACFVVLSFRFSSDPNKTKLGNFMTLLTILVVFESLLIWVGTYINRFTNDIPVFQLVMNVVFAATLHPLENMIRKFMRRWAIRKVRKKIGADKAVPGEEG